ncbi:MAG: preprotein translocase subunit YajC [Candidatus Zixiibacteriota bacterium]
MDFLLMATPQGGSGGSSNILGMVVPFALMILVLYFLMIRPQQKRAKEHTKMLTELKKGDRIITTGGMYGTVFGFSDDENKVIIKVSDEVKMEFLKSAIAQKVA